MHPSSRRFRPAALLAVLLAIVPLTATVAAQPEDPTSRPGRGLIPDVELRPGSGPCAGMYEPADMPSLGSEPRACYHALEVFLDPAADAAPVIDALQDRGIDVEVHDHGGQAHVHSGGPVDVVRQPGPAKGDAQPTGDPAGPADPARPAGRPGLGEPSETAGAPLAIAAADPVPAVPPGIPCSTTTSTTNAVRVFYLWQPGQPDRSASIGQAIREGIAVADDIVDDSAGQVGVSRHVRWRTTAISNGTCDLIIEKYQTSASHPLSIGDALHAAGKVQTGDKVLAYIDDGQSSAGSCAGLGAMYIDERPSTSVNANNIRYDVQVAMVYGGCFVDARYSSLSGMVSAHELFHTFGAVQEGAPHSTSAGHCYDEWDVMCYEDAPDTNLQTICAKTTPERLDCNKNDYFNPGIVSAGSYLYNHWNTAKSSWLTTTDPTARDPLERPTVGLTGITGGGVVGGAVSPGATATSSPGVTISRVDFYRDGTLVGSDGTAPFKMPPLETRLSDYEGFPNGRSLTFQAVAFDSIGRAGGSSEITVTVGNPKVRLTSPMPGTTGGSLAWTATASAYTGRTVTKVQLLVDGAVKATDTTSPFGGTVALSGLGMGDYPLVSARVTDSAGVTRTTPARELVADGPEVTLTSPVPWEAAPTRGPMLLGATARTIPGRTISSVKFLVGGVVVATDTTSPYTFLWDPGATSGSRTVKARATDSTGLTAESQVTTVQLKGLTASSVTVDTPASGASLPSSGTGQLTATVTPSGTYTPWSVDYYVDGQYVGGSYTGPDWAVDVDTGSLALGWHVVRAVATLTSSSATLYEGSVGTSFRVSGSIGSSFTKPATDGTTVTSSLTATVDVTPPAGRTVGGVDLYIDGMNVGSDYGDPATIVVSTAGMVDGTHLLRAAAHLDDGVSWSWSTRRFVTVAYTKPRVTAPAADSTVSGTKSISAAVNLDPEAQVEWIRFYVDGVKIASDSSSPYSASWDTTDVSNGDHDLSVTLVTTDGRTIGSTIRTVTVDN